MAKKEKEVKESKKNKNFLKEMKMELKKVTWPTPKELLNNTVAVIVFVLIIAVIVFVLDFCFDNLNKHVIAKFQEKVQSSFKVESDEDTETSDESNDSENLNEEESNENSEQENNEENKTEATEIKSQETETEKNESQE